MSGYKKNMPVIINEVREPFVDSYSIDTNITSVAGLELRCEEILRPFLMAMVSESLLSQIQTTLSRAFTNYCHYFGVTVYKEDVSIFYDKPAQIVRFRLHPGIISNLQKTVDWRIATAKRQGRFCEAGKRIVRSFGHVVKWGKVFPHTPFDINGHCEHCDLYFSVYQVSNNESSELSVDESIFGILHEKNVDDWHTTEDGNHLYCRRFKAML